MSTKDGRVLECYLPGKIPSQPRLLCALEGKGVEAGESRILTTRRVGVPVTVYAMVLYEACESLRTEESTLQGFGGHRENVPAARLLEAVPLERIGSTSIMELEWERHRGLDGSTTAAASGCTSFHQADYYYPSRAVLGPLGTVLRSTDPSVSVADNHVVVSDPDAEMINMIGVFKSTFTALEMFYAIDERLKAETSRFNSVLGKSIEPPPLPILVKSQCSRRGDLVHSGNIGLDICTRNMLLLIQRKPLVEELATAFGEVCSHAEEVYRRMLHAL